MEFYEIEDNNLIRRLVGWIVDIVVVIAFAWFTVYSFGTQLKIAGQSMTPLLNPDEVVLMNRLIYDFGSPERFDVVVFQREDDKANVKRVIGLPGEEIQIKGGYIYIDGEPLQAEDGLDFVSLAGLAENPIQLGEDEYFLLGDNRDSSEDSRFSNIGNVKKEQILGKVWIRMFPLISLEII
ncbi:MAG: signal peptidase I [Lachnospiraceae bacterium]